MEKLDSVWTASQLMSTKNYEINYYKDKDFKTVNLHSHDFYELYFFIRGKASYLIENDHYDLQAGDILLISPKNLHQLDITDSRETYERIVLWLSPKYIKKLSSSKTNLSSCFDLSCDEKNFLIRDIKISEQIKNMLFDLLDKKEDNSFGNDIYSEIIIRQLLLLLAQEKLQHKGDKKHSRNNPTITKTLDYIEQNISGDLSLDQISENLFVSKFYLSRLFKEETNSTLHKYILKKRLLLSKQLIEQGLAINVVYQKCGFIDYSHFFRAFKNEYGITPKQYFLIISN